MNRLARFKEIVEEHGQAQVARVSGVSKSTVSQVFNDKYDVDPTTQIAKVIKAYEEKDMEQIPEGYKRNALGHLIPVGQISEIDITRDDLVEEIVGKAKKLSGVLNEFKQAALGDVAAFVQLSAETYKVKVGGRKGNVTLTSFDGRYRIVRAKGDILECDERIVPAKALLDECIKGWTKGSREELQALVDKYFSLDQAGKVNVKLVLSLRRFNFKNEKWRRAMEAISDSLQVIGTRTYLRIYERVGETDQYQQIGLDIVNG